MISPVVHTARTVSRFLWRLVSTTYMVSWPLRICDMASSSTSSACWGTFTAYGDDTQMLAQKQIAHSFPFQPSTPPLGQVLLTGKKSEAFKPMGSFRVAGMIAGSPLGTGVAVITDGRAGTSSCKEQRLS